jgi:GNAT superfamily N-acetyltransferase
MQFVIREVKKSTPHILPQIQNLLQQLSDSAPTLVVFRIPTGLIARIEDVVVDQNSRNTGIGEALMQQAIIYAKNFGVSKIELTSHPGRKAANRLYLRLGFTPKETNVYQYRID